VDVVQLLLDRDADVGAKDVLGETALHKVTGRGACKKIVQLLLDRGADIKVKDKKGKTPLQIASANYDEAVVRVFKRHAEGLGEGDKGAKRQKTDKGQKVFIEQPRVRYFVRKPRVRWSENPRPAAAHHQIATSEGSVCWDEPWARGEIM